MTIAFAIICPEKEIARGEAAMLTAPGSEGEFGILEHHAPFATLLRAGAVIVEYAEGNKDYFYVRSGFLRADHQEVVILADAAAPLADLDQARLRQTISDRQDDIAHFSDPDMIAEARQELLEAEAQRAVIERSQP